jgi:hypothetical protein
MICFRLKVETLIIPFRLIPLFLCFNLVQSPRFSIEDFIQVLHLNFSQTNLVVKTLGQIQQLITFRDWLKSSPFNVSELRFILKGEENNAVKYMTNLETLGKLIQETQQPQVPESITLEKIGEIVQEVQKAQGRSRIEELKNYIANSLRIKSDILIEILKFVSIDINDLTIQTALNATFTNNVPDDALVLTPLFNLIREINYLEALQKMLSKSFNLSSNQVLNLLLWVDTDIHSAQINAALNTAFTNNVPNQPLDVLLTLVKEIERVLLLFSNLKFKEGTTAYLTQKPLILGITDIKNLTLDNLKALTSYRDFITLSEEAEPIIQSTLDIIPHSFGNEGLSIGKLADLWKQDKSLIESLTNSLSLSIVPIEALKHLWDCLNLCKTLGINGYSLHTLADDTDFAKLSVARDVALGAFSSKYEDEKIRQETLEPYQDKINLKKRDALCNYIIARKELKFKELDNLNAFFLLDVKMGDCFRISRLGMKNK